MKGRNNCADSGLHKAICAADSDSVGATRGDAADAADRQRIRRD